MRKLSLFVTLVLLVLTASLWRTSAQSSQACLPMAIPLVTHGPDGDQRVVQNQKLTFSVSATAGAAFNVFNENNNNLGVAAVANLDTQGVSVSTPGSTTTALSCVDKFWDGNFVVRKSGNTVGDTVTIFLEQGSVRTPLITLVTEAGGARVTQRADHFSINNRGLDVESPEGTLLPFTAAGREQTPVITFSMGQSLMVCGRLGIEITRGSGSGTTSVVFSDMVVIRDDSDGGTASGQGINRDGSISSDPSRFGHYPTGLVCPVDCPPCKMTNFLVIDEDSIDNGIGPNFFSAANVNDDVAEIGVRSQLRYFANPDNFGKEITLFTGQVGDEGWFAPKTIPRSWNNAGPTTNGLCNFLGNPGASPTSAPPHGVGGGLGAPDRNGDREALLDKIPNVTPLRADGLKLLEGRQVCAVVYDSDISINYGPLNGSLKGANLGTVAFEVLSVTRFTGGSSGSLPQARIKILDARSVCNCSALKLFTEAPVPRSSSEPYDVVP